MVKCFHSSNIYNTLILGMSVAGHKLGGPTEVPLEVRIEQIREHPCPLWNTST